METKYGTIPDSQFESYRKRIHSLIHWLLVYADRQDPTLPDYFSTVQFKLLGLNSLLNYPIQIVEMMNLLESAKIEYSKPDYDHRLYRRTILDLHDLVDRIANDE